MSGLGRIGLNYFRDQTVATITTEWTLFDLKFEAIDFFLVNDALIASENWIEFSFDGQNTHGVVAPQEWRTRDNMEFKKVWLRCKISNVPFRLECY